MATADKQGAALFKAVERIVENPARIAARVDALMEEVEASLPHDTPKEQLERAIERRIIASYSNRTALAGGAAALPSLIPAVGSLAAVLTGGLMDMTLCLKFEVEMVLALARARGYDIADPRERRLAYLLAAVHTYEASGGKVPVADLLKTELDAIWNYTPRQLTKLVAGLFVKLALLLSGRGLVRAIPVVGIVVSSTTNKALTTRVGRSVVKALDARRARAAKESAPRKPAAKKPAARRPAKKRAGGTK